MVKMSRIVKRLCARAYSGGLPCLIVSSFRLKFQPKTWTKNFGKNLVLFFLNLKRFRVLKVPSWKDKIFLAAAQHLLWPKFLPIHAEEYQCSLDSLFLSLLCFLFIISTHTIMYCHWFSHNERSLHWYDENITIVMKTELMSRHNNIPFFIGSI